MIRWIKTIIRYTGIIVLHFLLLPPARILRLIHSGYRALWLISERGYDARDNGYWFYRYLRTDHPEINAYYVITKDSADRDRVSFGRKTVPYGSLRHFLMYYAADYLIGTHVQPAAPGTWTFYRLSRYGIRARGRQVFLQHGITINNVKHLHYPGLRINLFLCGARPEYEHIQSDFGHPEGVVQYTGFPRYDALYGADQREREILLMPT
ncbi:MAG: CDP-glycerol glycerophosphotransferase family protein [Lachnospiraceae bacterium]|nr:CDP-glycerol glycerophosphotransferase family protein [Lachnospiraceae bacterium]